MSILNWISCGVTTASNVCGSGSLQTRIKSVLRPGAAETFKYGAPSLVMIFRMKKGLLVFTVAVAVLAVTLSLHSQAQATPQPQASPGNRTYVGSGTCGDCHVSIYERWAKTRMANV